jgi:UDP-N-acetylglucosamine/UDP-N-acetylgalactosamine diphosphorylase
MDDTLNTVKSILKKYKQEHLINFIGQLTETQKSNLLNQIINIDFDEILELYNSFNNSDPNPTEEIEPLNYTIKDSIPPNKLKQYYNTGIKAIKSGKVGIITLAGGQGSRLGFKGPKGTFCLDIEPKISLFEILCNYIKVYADKYKVNIPWYIMTSTSNYFDTINFFEQNNFFDYPRKNIQFFTQDNLPIIDINGKLVLSEIYKIHFASNGNGNVFHSLKKANLISDMESRKLHWLFIGGVDNVLLNPLDPIFIGFTISNKNPISSKTLFKEDPKDIDWVFANKKGHPSIVDCENFTEQISKIKDKKGNFLYRETNMLAHLFSLNAIKKVSNIKLPYHRAFRKNAFVNDEGMKQVPDCPNVYKFEQFVFDAFSYFNNISLLRVNKEDEFAPIKDFNGPHNPEIAAEKYKKLIIDKK